jgi:hypothetical protein
MARKSLTTTSTLIQTEPPQLMKSAPEIAGEEVPGGRQKSDMGVWMCGLDEQEKSQP